MDKHADHPARHRVKQQKVIRRETQRAFRCGLRLVGRLRIARQWRFATGRADCRLAPLQQALLRLRRGLFGQRFLAPGVLRRLSGWGRGLALRSGDRLGAGFRAVVVGGFWAAFGLGLLRSSFPTRRTVGPHVLIGRPSVFGTRHAGIACHGLLLQDWTFDETRAARRPGRATPRRAVTRRAVARCDSITKLADSRSNARIRRSSDSCRQNHVVRDPDRRTSPAPRTSLLLTGKVLFV